MDNVQIGNTPETRHKVRETEIMGKFLLPENDMASIAKSYKLSRERVRQIIEKANKYNQTNLREIKKELFKNSEKFRCLFCGTNIYNEHDLTSKHASNYCSTSCYYRNMRYDTINVLVCMQCHNEFYPSRSKTYSLRLNKKQTTFCCMQHYHDYKKEHLI